MTGANGNHRDRTALLLAGSFAIMPLLPYGPVHLGLGRGPWIEAGLLVLALLWALARVRGRTSAGRRLPSRTRPAVDVGLAVWIAAILGAGFVGLAADNRLGSQVFAAHLHELPRRVVGPIDQEFDVLVPLRVAAVYLLGPLGVLLARDLCRRGPDPRRRARVAVAGWIAGCGIVSVIAIGQLITGAGLHPAWVRMEPDVIRTQATLDDPNALGAYLALGLVTAVTTAIARWRHGVRPGRLLPAVGVVAVLAMATTGSRSAWVAAALVLAGVLVGPRSVPRRGPGWSRVLVPTLVAAFGLAIALTAWRPMAGPELAAGRGEPAAREAATPASAGLGDRLALWNAALEMAAEHPLTGVGLGRYRPLLRSHAADLGYTENAHSFPLQVLAETGLVGLLAALAAAGALALRLCRLAVRLEPPAASLALGGLAGLGAFTVAQLTGNGLLLPSGQVLAGLLAGALLALGSAEPKVGAPPDAGATRRRLLLPLASGVLCLFVVAGLTRPGPPQATDRWGYGWGLYSPERPERPWAPGPIPAAWSRLGISTRDVDLRRWTFRWTRDRAILELRAPAGARGLLLPLEMPASPSGPPVTLWAFADEAEARIVQGAGRRVLEIPIAPVEAPGGRRVLVRLEVDGAFRPSLRDGSADGRLLGVALWPVAYEF